MIAPATAHADHNAARINEVLLSKNSTTDIQYLEIEDTSGVAYGDTGYGVRVYDAAGEQVFFQTIVLSGGVTRVMLATTAARTDFGLGPTNSMAPNPILGLNDTLPSVGTACFRYQGTDLHCLAWGNPTAPSPAATNGTQAGPAPTDGMSIQRQPTCGAVGAPTANAVNATLTCQPVTADAGPNPDAGTGGGDEDDGCSTGSGAGWLAGLVALSMIGRTSRRRRSR